ncbi:undecaprenyl-diphosphatase [Plantactinospora mayteni]|uniref:Undecaprenyl-diphosphatase n=1 Tax=Plantactinospora mayteni TaxID=566021 RepID=A0ABQ4F4K1_9ACTN|nr:phosphatase PAP2 family protein [Plantactinospora mayteni]GIH01839.1 undecaprenyl-diphosphatase [Plantactinospora mayteni]
MNFHLFQIINGAAGAHDPVDDLLEWAAIWLIFVMAALTLVPGRTVLRVGGWTVLARVGLALLLAVGIGQAVGHLNHEPRPFQAHEVHQLIPHANDVSMPSDHATAAFALAFAVTMFLSRRWGAVLTFLALAVGFARVWTGVHYPGDILAGALIGAAAVAIVLVGERLLSRRSAPAKATPTSGINR